MDDRIWTVSDQLFFACMAASDPLAHLNRQLAKLQLDHHWSQSEVAAIERRTHRLLHSAANDLALLN